MNEDPRCCGTGTCIIDAEGFCWCGQKWDGEKMCFPARAPDPQEGRSPDSAQTGKTSGPGGDRAQ